jgi:hypothetical protein
MRLFYPLLAAWIAVLLLPLELSLAVNVAVTPVPHIQFLDVNGKPLAGGIICTYAGGTTTPLATYKDATGTTQNGVCSSPGVGGITLDSGGFTDIWLVPRTYRKSRGPTQAHHLHPGSLRSHSRGPKAGPPSGPEAGASKCIRAGDGNLR